MTKNSLRSAKVVSLNEITLTQLRALLAVQRHGGVTSAAASLRVTQPVLTRALRLLEQRAKDELLQMQGKLIGRVALACSPIPMMLFVPEAIGHFRRSFRDVEVRG